MSDSQDQDLDQREKQDDLQRHTSRKASPYAGCLIFIILIVVFTSLGGFIIWHYIDTQKAIHAISEETQREVPSAKYVPSELEDLKAKLETFSRKVKAGTPATLNISANELNLGILKLDKMSEFKSKMYITKITQKAIHAEIAFPVKGGFTTDRYLNGEMEMLPVIEQGSIFPKVVELRPVTGSAVPEKVKRFIPQALFSGYRTDPDLEAVFHKLSTVKLEDGKMIVTSDPNHKPVIVADPETEKENFYTGLAVFGILFFVTFTTVCLILWLRKRSKENKARLLAEESTDVSTLENEEVEHRKAAEQNHSD